MKEKEIIKWKTIREKGRGNYIFKICILMTGIPTGIIAFFTSEIYSKGFSSLDVYLIVGCIIAGIIFGIVYGIVYGLITWGINERLLKKMEQ